MDNDFKILMLEDSELDAEIIQRFLLKEKPGCRFKLVMDEQNFIEALDTFEPQLILSDNTLPQYSAAEALEVVKQRQSHIPFILITGTVSEEFAAGIIKAGADDYLLKDRLTRLPTAIDAALQKKRAEEEQKKAEEIIRFKADLLKSVGQAVIATDLGGIVLYWNHAAEKIYGWTAEEAQGKNILDLTPAKQSTQAAATIMKELKAGRSWSGEFFVQRKNGTVFLAFVTDSPLFDPQGNLSGIIGVSYDITEQKKAETALMEMEKQIAEQKIKEQKEISRAIIKGQEEEKNHIGKELHDNINQILAGAKMFLAMAAKKNNEIKKLLDYPIELINNSIEEIRSLTYKQVTPLKNINLQLQVNKLIESISHSTPNPVEFRYQANENSLTDDLKLNLYRIIQEQVNNILKHADAKKITIEVAQAKEHIRLQIDDDGKGFDTAAQRKGIGISNMINRVEAYEGALHISSIPGQGCTLKVQIPV